MSKSARRRFYSGETKAAVMAALLEGQPVSSLARKYEIPKGTVSGWKRQAHESATEVGADTTPRREIGELLGDPAYQRGPQP